MEPPDFSERLIDFNRLFDGEDRNSADPEDAQHWYRVYADLLQFKQELLSKTVEHASEVPETARELEGVDVPFLEAEMMRLRNGLAFWEARLKK